MPIDDMTLRRLLQARPDLAPLLRQTQATAPTMGGFMPEVMTRKPAPPTDVMLPSAEPSGFANDTEPPQAAAGGLWDRVKGFFEPDEPDLNSAGWAGAAQAAAEASANPQLSPIQVLTQSLAGYSSAKQRAKAGLRSEAREDRLFGLKERELEGTLAESEAKAAQRRQLMEQIAAIEDPMQRRAAMLNPEAYGAQVAKQAFPEPQKPIEVDGVLVDPVTFQPVYTAPKKPIEVDGALVDPVTFQPIYTAPPEAITPYQQADLALRAQLGMKPTAPVPQYELEGGVRLNRFTGEIEKIPGATKPLSEGGQLAADIAAMDPSDPRLPLLEAELAKRGKTGSGGAPVSVRIDGRDVLVDPERAVREGLTPSPRESGGSTSERDRARVNEIKLKVEDGQKVTPEEYADYEYIYSQLAAPKDVFDPAIGNYVRTQPDVSFLPNPEKIRAQVTSPVALPAPVAGGPPSDVPRIESGIPPRPLPPEVYGPKAGQTITAQGATKEQVGKFNDALTAANDLTGQTTRMRELLAEGGGQPALTGPRANRMQIVSQGIISTIGKLSAAGVLDAGERAYFLDLFGDPTSIVENIKNRTGLSSFDAKLSELETRVATNLSSRAKEGNVANFTGMSDVDADAAFEKLPKGASFIDSDGLIKRK